jgi:hypothetical protein
MGNTINHAQLVGLSQKIYQEWYPRTVLVQSCDNQFEGELNLETRELDIPVYHDLSIHVTTLRERELKPASIEFIKASTKRVSIDRGRYSHWGVSEISKLVEKLSAEDSETRTKLVNKWAVEAEKELAIWCAQLPARQTIDFTDADLIPAVSGLNAAGEVNKHSVVRLLDILKAKIVEQDMEPSEFTLFASEKFETVLRDANLVFDSIPSAQGAFTQGVVGRVNGVDVMKTQVSAITARDAKTSMVNAEWGIWKTRDGIQYVVPYRNTVSYTIDPDQILLGGTGYQTIEYYDFFNLYPTRLFKVQISYDGSTTAPSV